MNFERIEKIINHNYWTNWLGLSRSLLAFATLITLFFNDENVLFHSGLNNENFKKFDTISINMYSWFNNFEYGLFLSYFVLILVVVGFYPRFTCIFHWLVTYSFNSITSCGDGGDLIASNITFLLIPICLFDKRKTHWSKEVHIYNFYQKTIATSFYWLICIQVFIIYFWASVGKFKVDEWGNGTAIYYWLTDSLFGAREFFMPLLNIILKSPILTTFVTWSVLVFELMLAFSFIFKSIINKKVILLVGLLFHFIILIIFGLVSFFLVMSACLILYLISKNNNYEYRSFNFSNIIRNFTNIFSIATQKN